MSPRNPDNWRDLATREIIERPYTYLPYPLATIRGDGESGKVIPKNRLNRGPGLLHARTAGTRPLTVWAGPPDAGSYINFSRQPANAWETERTIVQVECPATGTLGNPNMMRKIFKRVPLRREGLRVDTKFLYGPTGTSRDNGSGVLTDIRANLMRWSRLEQGALLGAGPEYSIWPKTDDDSIAARAEKRETAVISEGGAAPIYRIRLEIASTRKDCLRVVVIEDNGQEKGGPIQECTLIEALPLQFNSPREIMDWLTSEIRSLREDIQPEWRIPAPEKEVL